MKDDGFVVPQKFVDEVATVLRSSVWIPLSEEMMEDLGYPPRWKGLAYWHRRERDAIRAAHPVNRLRRRVTRIRWTLTDTPRRLRNARSALAGEWERSDDD